jgi:phage tail sheath gpL-like
VQASAVARVVGVDETFVDLRSTAARILPQRIAVIGQGNDGVSYSEAPVAITSAGQAAQLFGLASPLHRIAQVLFPSLGAIPVTFYPLLPDGAAVAAVGRLDISGTVLAQDTTFEIVIGGYSTGLFEVPYGTTVAEMITEVETRTNAPGIFPCVGVADVDGVEYTANFSGTAAHGMPITVIKHQGNGDGFIFTVIPFADGETNPDVTVALDQIGDRWETVVINGFEPGDALAIDTFDAWGEGQWVPVVRRPALVVTGQPSGSLAIAQAVTAGRLADRTNVLVVSPSSLDSAWAIAAGAAMRIAQVANDTPGSDFAGQGLGNVRPGPVSAAWDYVTANTAVESGVSTTGLGAGGTVSELRDVVTFYREGLPLPGYRYVVDVVKLQNLAYSLGFAFGASEWVGAPLIPDDQPTTNPAARKPKDARALIAAILDSFELEAIVSDARVAKQTLAVAINGQNPKRLDASVTVQLSGNVGIVSVDLDFGFLF